MGYSTSLGPVSISESAGVATVSISQSIQAGGGSVAGFVSAQLSASAQVSAIMLIDAGLKLAAAKYPSLAVEIAAIQGLVDSEIKNL
jgi:hypothetical protein